jgi:hypothetical protein
MKVIHIFNLPVLQSNVKYVYCKRELNDLSEVSYFVFSIYQRYVVKTMFR